MKNLPPVRVIEEIEVEDTQMPQPDAKDVFPNPETTSGSDPTKNQLKAAEKPTGSLGSPPAKTTKDVKGANH